MVLRMARPTRRKESSLLQFRRRIPADVQQAAVGRRVAFTFPGHTPADPPIIVHAALGRTQVRFSLRTRDPAVAKQRQGLATAQFEKLCEAIRNGPRPLTHRQRVALSGVLYRAFAENLADDPGDPEIWKRVREANKAALYGSLPGLMIGSTPDEITKLERTAAMERRFGPLVDLILQREGVIMDEESRHALLRRPLVPSTRPRSSFTATPTATIDRTPPPNASRRGSLPTSSAPPLLPLSRSPSCLSAGNKRRDRRRVPSRRGGCVRQFREHLGHDDPARVTRADVVAWKDALVAAGRSPKGIKDGQLSAVRSLFNYAVQNDLLPTNPAQGVRVRHSRASAPRMLPYDDAEVARLLSLADNARGSRRLTACR
jgi:hypothetical protein